MSKEGEGASAREELSDALSAINSAWLEGRLSELAPHVHPDIVMVLPGFAGRVTGKEAFLAGFEEFVASARVLSFDVSARSLDVAGPVGVASFTYAMLYERRGVTYRATGRDLWVFGREDGRWLAAWRTMLDVTESETR